MTKKSALTVARRAPKNTTRKHPKTATQFLRTTRPGQMNPVLIKNPYNSPEETVILVNGAGTAAEDIDPIEDTQEFVMGACVTAAVLIGIGYVAFNYWKGLPGSKDYLDNNLDL